MTTVRTSDPEGAARANPFEDGPVPSEGAM
jgi:hypothetical protein